MIISHGHANANSDPVTLLSYRHMQTCCGTIGAALSVTIAWVLLMAGSRVSSRPDPKLAIKLAEALLSAAAPPDAESWGSLMAEDVDLRICNRGPAIGRAHAVRELNPLFDKIASLGQHFRELWPSSDGQTALMELDFLLVAGGSPLPMAIVLRGGGSPYMVKDLRFYLDPRPLGFAGNTDLRLVPGQPC